MPVVHVIHRLAEEGEYLVARGDAPSSAWQISDLADDIVLRQRAVFDADGNDAAWPCDPNDFPRRQLRLLAVSQHPAQHHRIEAVRVQPRFMHVTESYARRVRDQIESEDMVPHEAMRGQAEQFSFGARSDAQYVCIDRQAFENRKRAHEEMRSVHRKVAQAFEIVRDRVRGDRGTAPIRRIQGDQPAAQANEPEVANRDHGVTDEVYQQELIEGMPQQTLFAANLTRVGHR